MTWCVSPSTYTPDSASCVRVTAADHGSGCKDTSQVAPHGFQKTFRAAFQHKFGCFAREGPCAGRHLLQAEVGGLGRVGEKIPNLFVVDLEIRQRNDVRPRAVSADLAPSSSRHEPMSRAARSGVTRRTGLALEGT
eukprot:1993399-Rhodomonas_salina.2